MTNTELCLLDGKGGRLSNRGDDLHDMAKYSTFEETYCFGWERYQSKSCWLNELRDGHNYVQNYLFFFRFIETAYALEQYNDNRLIRPRAEYVGLRYRQSLSILER